MSKIVQPCDMAKARPSHLVTGAAEVGTSFKGWVLLTRRTLRQTEGAHFERCRSWNGTQPECFVSCPQLHCPLVVYRNKKATRHIEALVRAGSLTACRGSSAASPAGLPPWRSAAPARWTDPGRAAPPAWQSPTAQRQTTCTGETRRRHVQVL